jgi:hypothetical protein
VRRPGRLLLAAEVLLAYARVRAALRQASLPAVVSGLRSRTPGPGTLGPAELGRLSRAVTRTLAPLPLDSRCLMRSLVLLALLGRRGVDGQLLIAVAPPAGDRLDAHAWVEVAGRPVLAPAGPEQGHLVTL